MAAAIDKGITAEAEPNDEGIIRIVSEGFPTIEVELDRLWPDEKEVGTSAALVRGMAGVLSESIPHLQGFNAHFFSDLSPGLGLSSSAAFAVLVGYILSTFSQDEPMAPEELARAAQKAENRWYGKPCGLMDQMACALGSGMYMDVRENKILSIPIDFDELGLALCLTDTGDSHAAQTEAYGQIAADMSAVAQTFGEQFLANVRASAFDEQWPAHMDDPQWMRARHFFDETFRVSSMADALGLRDGERYMELMNQSGRSSEELLRNIQADGCGAALAQGLETSALLLTGKGAWRVHGSGFGGCVQALMPESEFEDYRTAMDMLFGPGSCQRVRISARGVCQAQEDRALFDAREG